MEKEPITIAELHKNCLDSGVFINVHSGKLCGFVYEGVWV
jgi:hypothetical protein